MAVNFKINAEIVERLGISGFTVKIKKMEVAVVTVVIVKYTEIEFNEGFAPVINDTKRNYDSLYIHF
jgi:hypothetical protein